MKISKRIIILLVIVPVLVTTVYLSIMLIFRHNRINSTIETIGEFLHHIAERDREPLANEIFENRKEAAHIRIQRIMEIPEMRSIEVFDADGNLVTSTGVSGEPQFAPTKALREQKEYSIERLTAQRTPVLRFTTGIFAIGELLGYIRFSYSLEKTTARILLEFIILTSLFTAIPVLLFLSQYYTIRNSFVRPVQSIIASMKQIESQGPGVQISSQTKDELGDLAQSFNDMSRNLDVSYKQIQEQQASLQKSLKERELLIHDIHHRVKNNLAVILSLVRLEKNRIEQAEVKASSATYRAFDNILERISIISSIYGRLYQMHSQVDKIDSKEFMESLIRDIAGFHSIHSHNIALECAIEGVEIPINTVIPLSLMLGEILSNSYKHAFDGANPGNVFVRLKRKDGGIVLEVGDNGPGFQKDFHSGERSLGLKLIDMLAQQIGADMTLETAAGTLYTIRLI